MPVPTPVVPPSAIRSGARSFSCIRCQVLLLVLIGFCGSLFAESSVRLLVQNRYLPTLPVLVRVELWRGDDKDRETWNSEALLTVNQPGVTFSTNRMILRNGVGSALVTFSGGGNFNLTASVNGLSATKPLANASSLPITAMSGTLPGTSTVWSGVVQLTASVTVPATS